MKKQTRKRTYRKHFPFINYKYLRDKDYTLAEISELCRVDEKDLLAILEGCHLLSRFWICDDTYVIDRDGFIKLHQELYYIYSQIKNKGRNKMS